MRRSTFVLWLIILPLMNGFELIDYSNETYALIPIEHAYLYRENGTLFHVFNITDIEQRFLKYEQGAHSSTESRGGRLTLLISRCREHLRQLTIHRNKRGLNFLGSAISFVTGMPDHDDMMEVRKKLNDLIENNNRLTMVNSHLQENLEHLTGNSGERQLEVLFEWLVSELSQIIQTINLAKVGVLNTAVLNLQEVNQMAKSEKNFGAPLTEVLGHSTFKILRADSVYVLLIRYPKIEQKCMLYSVKPIEKEMGKLELEEFAAYCNEKYSDVRDCRKYVSANICRQSKHTCTQELLNKIGTKCSVVREHMPAIEEVDGGKILIHGNHTVNNVTRRGTFLVLFNNSILVDDQNFTNDGDLILEYLQRNRPTQYEILNVLEDRDQDLRFSALTIIERIPIEIEDHPIRSTIFFLMIVTASVVVLHYLLRVCKLYNTYAIRKEIEKGNANERNLIERRLGTISFNRERS